MKRQYSLIIFIWILKITNWNEQFFKLLFFFFFKCESCSVVSDSLWHHGLYSPWNSPGQNTGEVSLSLLQGIFPTQGSKPGLPHCRWIIYQLSHKGSPMEPFSSVAQSCPTLCDPMNRSTPGFPVHHHLPEFTRSITGYLLEAMLAIGQCKNVFSVVKISKLEHSHWWKYFLKLLKVKMFHIKKMIEFETTRPSLQTHTKCSSKVQESANMWKFGSTRSYKDCSKW